MFHDVQLFRTRNHDFDERVIAVEMETVKLSEIVLKWYPDMIPFLRQNELDRNIVLRDGMNILGPGDAMEIIHYSICDNQKNGYIH